MSSARRPNPTCDWLKVVPEVNEKKFLERLVYRAQDCLPYNRNEVVLSGNSGGTP